MTRIFRPSSLIICLNLLFILACFVECGKDFYKTLEVARDATEHEIKRSFRKLAMKRHPDKNVDDPDASKKFQELREAFEVLSDPKKRKIYDEGGEEALKRSSDGGFSGGGGDPFESFFGDLFGFSSGSQHADRETARGSDLTVDLWVSYDEIYKGQFVEIQRIKSVYQPSKGTRKCNCRQEMITRQLGPGRFQMMQHTVCDDCPNKELVIKEKILEVEVEPGVKDGAEQKFHGEGEPHIDGDPGDLKVRIRTLPHPVFERRGDDLYTNATISLAAALTGFTIDLEHLDGHTVKVTREKVTWPGAKVRKAGEGMPNYNNNHVKGALYITFDVDFPKGELSSEDREAIRNILAKYKTVSENSENNDKEIQATDSYKFYNGLRGY